MGRPQAVPGHPLKARTFRTTDRAWDQLQKMAEEKDEPAGKTLDRLLARLGGWRNDE